MYLVLVFLFQIGSDDKIMSDNALIVGMMTRLFAHHTILVLYFFFYKIRLILFD